MWTGGPAKHSGDTTQIRVPRPSRFCLGGDFILAGERPGILYHAVCSRADESQRTHPSKRREAWAGHPAAKTCFNCTAMDPSGATRAQPKKKVRWNRSMGIYWGCWEPKRTFQRKNKLYGSIEAKQKGASTDQHSTLCCGLFCILCRVLDGPLCIRAKASALKNRGSQ